MNSSQPPASAHTPGPWEVHNSTVITEADDPEGALGRNVAIVHTFRGMTPSQQETAIANARLIAAAPELLDVLSDVDAALFDLYQVERHVAGQYFGAALKARIEDAIANAR
jgi:hypothetical protein